MLTKDEKECIRRSCLEWWGLSDPETIEAYHAYRILMIKSEKGVCTFDDFAVAWSKDGS